MVEVIRKVHVVFIASGTGIYDVVIRRRIKVTRKINAVNLKEVKDGCSFLFLALSVNSGSKNDENS